MSHFNHVAQSNRLARVVAVTPDIHIPDNHVIAGQMTTRVMRNVDAVRLRFHNSRWRYIASDMQPTWSLQTDLSGLWESLRRKTVAEGLD